MAAHTKNHEGCTAAEIADMFRDLQARADNGESISRDELIELSGTMIHFLNPDSWDDTGLPEDPMPGVKYDPDRNEIRIPWKR